MQERISAFEHIDKTKFSGSRHDCQLTFLGTGAVESGRERQKARVQRAAAVQG